MNNKPDLVLTSKGSIVESSDINRLESHLGLPLPGEYAKFLLEFGFGSIIEGGSVFDVWAGEYDNPTRVIDSSSVDEILSPLQTIYDSIYEAINLSYYKPPLANLPVGTDIAGNSILLRLVNPYRGYVFLSYQDPGAHYYDGKDVWQGKSDDSLKNMFFVARAFPDFINSLRNE